MISMPHGHIQSAAAINFHIGLNRRLPANLHCTCIHSVKEKQKNSHVNNGHMLKDVSLFHGYVHQSSDKKGHMTSPLQQNPCRTCCSTRCYVGACLIYWLTLNDWVILPARSMQVPSPDSTIQSLPQALGMPIRARASQPLQRPA